MTNKTQNSNDKKLLKCTRLVAFLLLLATCYMLPTLANAAGFSAAPVVIDEKGYARDIIQESVTLRNDTGSKFNIYTFVNNIAIQDGKQEFLDPSKADSTTSLANWIEISRGVIDLEPHRSVTIPLTININLRAKPGVYHAVVAFAEGSTREEAERKLSSSPAVTVNLEVLEDIKEFLQIRKFVADGILFTGTKVAFSYEIENIGNRPLTPKGEVRIYNRRGKEVATVAVNGKAVEVPVGSSEHLVSVWEGARGFGKYKAFLDIEYGNKQRGAIQDTVFFWVTPWYVVLPVALVLVGLVIFIAVMIWRFGHHHRGGGRPDVSRPMVVDLRRVSSK